MSILCINFDWKSIITVAIPSLLVIVGWYIVYKLNRKNEIEKELRKYRLEMLQSIINFKNTFIKTNELNEELYDIMSIKIQTYGKKSEVLEFIEIDDWVKKDKKQKKVLENDKEFLKIQEEKLKHVVEEYNTVMNELEKISKNITQNKEKLDKLKEESSDVLKEELDNFRKEYQIQLCHIENDIENFKKNASRENTKKASLCSELENNLYASEKLADDIEQINSALLINSLKKFQNNIRKSLRLN